MHAPAPAREYDPALHGDGADDVEPAGQAYPGEHRPEQLDVARPVALPNVPSGHNWHDAEPGAAYWPARHTLRAAGEPVGHA